MGPFRYCKKTRHTGAINAKVLATMSCQNFSQDAPDPYHWTLNSCFGAFLSVLVHLELFRYCTKPAANRAKLVQLMQKFRPWCLVKFFYNERSRSTLLDPKIMFWSIFSDRVHFGPFRYCTKLGAKWANLVQLMQNFMTWFCAWIFRNERTWSTTSDPKLMFWCVSFRSGAFWTVSLLQENAPHWCI